MLSMVGTQEETQRTKARMMLNEESSSTNHPVSRWNVRYGFEGSSSTPVKNVPTKVIRNLPKRKKQPDVRMPAGRPVLPTTTTTTPTTTNAPISTPRRLGFRSPPFQRSPKATNGRIPRADATPPRRRMFSFSNHPDEARKTRTHFHGLPVEKGTSHDPQTPLLLLPAFTNRMATTSATDDQPVVIPLEKSEEPVVVTPTDTELLDQTPSLVCEEAPTNMSTDQPEISDNRTDNNNRTLHPSSPVHTTAFQSCLGATLDRTNLISNHHLEENEKDLHEFLTPPSSPETMVHSLRLVTDLEEAMATPCLLTVTTEDSASCSHQVSSNRLPVVTFADDHGKPLTTVYQLQDDPSLATGRLIIMLLCPEERKFEFLHAEYLLKDQTRLEDVLRQIPRLASNPLFAQKNFTQLFRTRPATKQLTNGTFLQDYHDIEVSELVVGVLEGYTTQQMAQYAMPLLLHGRITKAVRTEQPAIPYLMHFFTLKPPSRVLHHFITFPCQVNHAKKTGRGLKYILNSAELETKLEEEQQQQQQQQQQQLEVSKADFRHGLEQDGPPNTLLLLEKEEGEQFKRKAENLAAAAATTTVNSEPMTNTHSRSVPVPYDPSLDNSRCEQRKSIQQQTGEDHPVLSSKPAGGGVVVVDSDSARCECKQEDYATNEYYPTESQNEIPEMDISQAVAEKWKIENADVPECIIAEEEDNQSSEEESYVHDNSKRFGDLKNEVLMKDTINDNSLPELRDLLGGDEKVEQVVTFIHAISVAAVGIFYTLSLGQ